MFVWFACGLIRATRVNGKKGAAAGAATGLNIEYIYLKKYQATCLQCEKGSIYSLLEQIASQVKS